MDLLRTILVYMSLVFATSVQNAPVPSYTPEPTPTAVVATATPEPTPSPTPVPTINITPNPEYKTLQMGDNGELVLQMQAKLTEYGYYAGEIDGRFGNQTRRAVEQFQYQHGLSVDGIAGRHTLTVLYESEEIRLAPSDDVTPSPTPETLLTAAFTPTPSPTPAVTAEPSPAPTAAPTATPTFAPVQTATPEPAADFLAMEGYVFCLEGMDEPILSETAETLLPYTVEGELYLPLVDVLRAAGINVLSNTSLEMDEFAFALGNDLIRFTYTENQSGAPVRLQAYKNMEEQPMSMRDVYRAHGTLYLPALSVEFITDITAVVEESTQTIVIHIPE